MNTYGAGFAVFAKDIYKILKPHHGLISCRNHKRQGETALAHGNVRGKHPALRDDCGPVSRTITPMCKGPERYVIKVIDHSVTIWADHGHIADSLNQSIFQMFAVSSSLFEPRRVTDNATRPHL